MAELNVGNTTTTSLNTAQSNYEVTSKYPEGVEMNQKETYWDNTKAPQYFGYYKMIPELKKAIDALATWATGKGYTTQNSRDKTDLEHIKGWGEDTVESIFFNLLVGKKIFGDSYALIVRDEKSERLLNLKPLDPCRMRHVVDDKGMIKEYHYYKTKGRDGKPEHKFKPREILHLCNDRVADEIHGTSVIEACQWVIDARNEAMTDWRRVLHRNLFPVRMLEVDEDNTAKLATLKTQYQEAITKGEVIIVPKGTIQIQETNAVLQDPQSWIRYLENFFYNALGVPKVILGGSEEFTESSAKVGYLTFEQVYGKEQRELEADLWNQCQIKITFNKPASLRNEMLSGEEKNTGQTGFQPSDTQTGMEARA